MCTVSMIGDDFSKRFPGQYPWCPSQPWSPSQIQIDNPPSRVEFEALKREVEALKDLLAAAKKYDEATGQPDCEMDEKITLLRKIAEFVGVDLSDVFPGRDV